MVDDVWLVVEDRAAGADVGDEAAVNDARIADDVALLCEESLGRKAL